MVVACAERVWGGDGVVPSVMEVGELSDWGAFGCLLVVEDVAVECVGE